MFQIFIYSLDLRYTRQYHEVTVEIDESDIENADWDSIVSKFHPAHNNLFGYSLEEEGTPVELINLRLKVVGITDKPKFNMMEYDGEKSDKAYKKERKVFIPSLKDFKEIPVFDSLRLKFGNKIKGPAILEQVNTTAFIPPEYSVIVDKFGTYTVYLNNMDSNVTKRVLDKS